MNEICGKNIYNLSDLACYSLLGFHSVFSDFLEGLKGGELVIVTVKLMFI